MQIKVQIRSAYGQDRVYPACDRSRLLAKLANTKTLTRQHLVYISALGYSLEFYDTNGHWLANITAWRTEEPAACAIKARIQ